ncbi:Cbwd1 [Symbiodinium natans]|uniref:Cbwd1 protein n=1 Tax=Symbiodinium natans TaxID=878477 RepID=A0A812V4W2_9DINO|nr:Cbwd1 [Symbiodinium natans]
MADLSLTCWFHPGMKLPACLAAVDMKDYPFKVAGDILIMELMEKVEAFVEEVCDKSGEPVQFQIQVLWNSKNNKKALNPGDKVGGNFVDGDTFGIHGDLVTAPKSYPKIPDEQKLPVTILTGFLGAGKTTLLNYILQEQREKKIAVIENEFGEVSIDDLLLKKDKFAFAEKVVVMDNGCMCCTIRGDLIDGFRQILDEVEKGAKLDQIIIETTGMADPVPIVRTFMTSEEISSRLRLDGVITVADAKNVLKRLDDEVEEDRVNEAYQQVAFCDKILLNKLDLVSSEEAIQTKERLREINAFAKIVPAVRGRVKLSELTNIRAHDMSNFVHADIEKEAMGKMANMGGMAAMVAMVAMVAMAKVTMLTALRTTAMKAMAAMAAMAVDTKVAMLLDMTVATAVATGRSRHDSRVNSFSVVREGEVLPEKLGKLMETLGTLPPEQGVIFRIKGILAVKNHPFKHVFHAVMDVSDEDDAEAWAPGEKRITKMVFIGKKLDKPFIRKIFEDCFEK